MNFNIQFIKKISVFYLSISMFIFIIGWYNIWVATISCLALFFILKDIWKETSDKTFFLEKKYIFIILAIITAVVYLSGAGGFFFQHKDYHIRNALLNDLTKFSFPVIIDENIALVYYFGLLLVPVLAGKLFNSILVVDVFSFIWFWIGLFLVVLNLLIYTNSKKIQAVWAVLILLFFGSTAPLFLDERLLYAKDFFIWHFPYLHMNNYINLCATSLVIIPIWILTILFLEYKDRVSYYGVISLFMLFYCPQILLGFSIFLIPFFICNIYKNCVWHEIFNIKNILSLILMIPLILFFASNYTSSTNGFFLKYVNVEYFKHCFYDYGLYFLLLLIPYRKNIFYWLSLLSLLLLPMICFSTSYDFGIKAIIPASFVLCILLIKFLLEEENRLKIIKYLLLYSLFFALTSSVIYIGSSFSNFYILHIGKRNNLKTFQGDKYLGWQDSYEGDTKNYVSIDYKKYIFWKYIAKKF